MEVIFNYLVIHYHVNIFFSFVVVNLILKNLLENFELISLNNLLIYYKYGWGVWGGERGGGWGAGGDGDGQSEGLRLYKNITIYL